MRPRTRLVEPLAERVDDRSTPARLRRNETRAFPVEPADGTELVERLPHADETDAAAGRINDHIGHAPSELLGELESHGLLTFDAVRLTKGRGVVPTAVRADLLHDGARIGDRSGDRVDLPAVGRSLAHDDLRRPVGHDDDHADAGACPVRRPCGAGIARARERERLDAELGRARHADRRAACLERARGQQALVLYAEPRDAELLAERWRFEKRRVELAKSHGVLRILVR